MRQNPIWTILPSCRSSNLVLRLKNYFRNKGKSLIMWSVKNWSAKSLRTFPRDLSWLTEETWPRSLSMILKRPTQCTKSSSSRVLLGTFLVCLKPIIRPFRILRVLAQRWTNSSKCRQNRSILHKISKIKKEKKALKSQNTNKIWSLLETTTFPLAERIVKSSK